MSEVAERVSDANVFGVCPKCLSNDGYLNVGKTHWFVCHKHKARWCYGANIFSSWRHESEETWEWNAERLEEYEEVEPFIVNTSVER